MTFELCSVDGRRRGRETKVGLLFVAPLLSSSFRKGMYLINTVRSGVRFHLGKD